MLGLGLLGIIESLNSHCHNKGTNPRPQQPEQITDIPSIIHKLFLVHTQIVISCDVLHELNSFDNIISKFIGVDNMSLFGYGYCIIGSINKIII